MSFILIEHTLRVEKWMTNIKKYNMIELFKIKMYINYVISFHIEPGQAAILPGLIAKLSKSCYHT